MRRAEDANFRSEARCLKKNAGGGKDKRERRYGEQRLVERDERDCRTPKDVRAAM